MLQHLMKRTLVKGLWGALGRKNLVRFSRFLANEARLDLSNDMDKNGELDVQAASLRMSSHDPIIAFDVGANVGDWSLSLLSQEIKRKKRSLLVHAFEPCPETFATLNNNLKTAKAEMMVKSNQLALSYKSGYASFFSAGANMGINGLYRESGGKSTQEEYTVKTLTIDEYSESLKVLYIDLLKIDAEGHDLEVLRGAKGLFKKGQIQIAQFEYNHRWINARCYLKDAFDYFAPFDYAIGKITPKGIEFYERWDFELETFREANYLVAKRTERSAFKTIKWWKT